MNLIPLMTRKNAAGGNPGDVFICYGLQYLMEKTYGESLPWFYLDKFSPADFEKYQSVLKKAGYLIYAGTPQYNNYEDWICWYDWQVWKDYLIPLGIKFHTIAGGSGFPDPLMSPVAFSAHCRKSEKTRAILNSRRIRTGLNTVRDMHAYTLLIDSGYDTNLLPCTATWSSKYLGVNLGKQESTVLVPPNPNSVLPEVCGASNSEEVPKMLLKSWGALYERVRDQNPLIVCHSKSEYDLFKDAGYNTFFSNDNRSLMKIYSHTRKLISSRLHGCLPAHGLGVEQIVSIAIDTRGSAVELCNIPQVPYSDFNIDNILSCLEICNPPDLEQWENDYSKLFTKHLELT